MSKSKKRKQRNKKQKLTTNITYSIDKDLNIALNDLAIKRKGGAINFRGMGFQLLYSCFTLLNELNNSNLEKSIRLEGIEDLDVIEVDNNQYIQLKSSINTVDAGSFWKMGVLQNFLDAFTINPNCNLKIVYNFKTSKGNLNDLVIKKITDKTVSFWKQKFADSSIDINNIDFDLFIRNIDFINVSESYLIESCNKLLFEKFNINLGTENQFLKALFYSSFNWSRERTSVKYLDLKKVFQLVTDSFSKSPTNQAIENNWIQKIDFDSLINSIIRDDYFEGKAAKPIHIAQDLPVKRNEWHSQIIKGISENSIVVVKSSSGQGKSTLAWQTTFELKQNGYAIYELKYCNDINNVASLFDFVESRVQIGELPIIVIDGINNTLSKYYELIDRTHFLPVKFIITTRQVDWYRYGLDLSKASTKIIDISLSVNEAKTIFFELKKRNKIHSEISNWQSVWEKIESKGLLIEYVYLLTKGEMLSNRLGAQIKEVNTEKDANSKIEILRLISIADVLGLKIKSINLINHIQENIGFITDRGEALKQLEKEFYLKFEEEFIEGLHPVRSQHLVDILNDFIPIANTLLSLYKIITEDFIYDYFINVSPLIKSNSKDSFYNDLAKLVSKQKFSEMVFAIDGLMHSEPLQYWTENKAIFDDVFNHGVIELFITETLPFIKLDTIKSLSESLGDKLSGLNFLSQKSEELARYDIKESDIIKFINYLSNHLDTNSNNIKSYQGLGFLIKWFKQLSVSIPLKIELSESKLLEILKNESIDEASELFSYYNITNSKKHLRFVKKHKDLIIGILKRQTNSLTIKEKGENIHIEYLLDQDADKANEFSVYRIQTVHNLLPIYNKYCTKAIILPFPNEEIYKVVLQNSIKAMPKENIVNTFDVHINQIWNNTILDKYRSSSNYEWQNQYIKIREEALNFSKVCVRYFESSMEGNQSRFKSSLNKLIAQITLLSNLLSTTKGYARQSRRYFDKAKFSEYEKGISDWCASLRNTLNQLANIVEPKQSNDRSTAFGNLKAVFHKLIPMQQSFDNVVESSFVYYDISKLKEEEGIWYDRLLITVSYYVLYFIGSNRNKLFNSKATIRNWWETYNKNRLEEIHHILKEFENESYFSFHLPNRVIEIETLREVVIGISGLIPENFEEDSLYLIEGLVNLSSTGIDFFNFVNIQDSKAISNGFRVQKVFFERFKNFIETGEFEESDYGNPIPINVDEVLLKSLDGVTIKENLLNKNAELFTKMMFDIWKLSEYRNRLNNKNDIENEWLQEMEKEYRENIQKYLNKIELSNEFQNNIENFIKGSIIFSNDEIIESLTNHLSEISTV